MSIKTYLASMQKHQVVRFDVMKDNMKTIILGGRHLILCIEVERFCISKYRQGRVIVLLDNRFDHD